jgi:Spy/CpxP family protein refolding chaperone
MMILKDDKHNRPGGYMKKTLLLIGALILVAGMVAYAGPGGYGRNCQANCEMGKGMGPGNGQGMGQGMGRGMGMRGHRGMERGDGIGRLMMMADELQLTDQQKEKIHTLMSSFRLEQIDRRAAMQKAQVKMADLRRNDKASEAEVMAGIDGETPRGYGEDAVSPPEGSPCSPDRQAAGTAQDDAHGPHASELG